MGGRDKLRLGYISALATVFCSDIILVVVLFNLKKHGQTPVYMTASFTRECTRPGMRQEAIEMVSN